MHFPISVLAILIIVGFARADDSDQSWQIHGQVVDEQGTPVEDFEAATFWSSNGKLWDEAGELIKVTRQADIGQYWKEEGVLAADPRQIATRLPEGRSGHIIIMETSSSLNRRMAAKHGRRPRTVSQV